VVVSGIIHEGEDHLGIAYASCVGRLWAWLIDFAIVWLPIAIIISVVEPSNDASALMTGVVIAGPALIVLPLYYVVMHVANDGQTLGKMVLSIAVKDANGLSRISWRQSLVRTYVTVALWLLAYIPAFIDASWALFSPRSQTLHDLMARTVVVRVDSKRSPAIA
jgi:uncharacterized RDD family membrane protein YckC